jgi:molybdopterin-guanine dinucleotide biosynthesis protein A
VGPQRFPDVIGAVLAGGLGTRMGGGKATVELAGRPLIDYPLAALDAAGIEQVVVAKRATELPKLTVPVWLEQDEPAHPLRGIVTALERADGRAVVVCGCDTPFVTAQLLAELASRKAQLVVPRASSRLHPLVARYDPALLGSLRKALGSEQSLHDLIGELDPDVISERDLRGFGDPARLLFNINTAADLAGARDLLAAEAEG